MAFSQDKGRHRRGRWWRRGSYLFSRRSEAPRGADRSFWSDVREKPREAPDGPAEGERVNGAGRGRRPGAERPEHRSWPGAEHRPEQQSWDGFALRERPERLPAAVLERPRYSWYDFELDDRPPRAEPHRPDAPSLGDGLRHCGKLESILHRQWDARQGPPPPDVVRAVESLARLPDRLKEKLAEGLEGIYVGPGGVPDLDDMGYLRGAPLPSGRATWDICAGAYGDRKIVVGDRPSPTPDVMMHEVGHAIDDIDSAYGAWVSDSPEFVYLYEKARPILASAFHRQGGGLGRKEFFADAFAAIAARQRPALVDMLGGDTRMALDVMLFFNRRYGI
ncbi:hypothetical protein MF672_012755 [Actinomadura sp. ATCC 31491]|uniref:Lysine-specific metallo-endopeptidase domain-containing protein n=1 Tax=Actinomadura luzonensis TaxID=2805427 RepID=A0ABT0FQR6_9ACTN|nr:hypothetical protein [Actinomadura luzonensis]MCK2214656.1 hypothetical protein [Actinomadura luzonensis]